MNHSPWFKGEDMTETGSQENKAEIQEDFLRGVQPASIYQTKSQLENRTGHKQY